MTDSELSVLTATEAAPLLAEGRVSAEDYAKACLARIAEADPEIRAFAHLDQDFVLAQARDLDARRASGAATGPLHGIPVAVKDIIDTADFPTECGSPVLAGRRPWHDATVVARLRAAGALVIGKTVTTEFAYYHPGPTRNPHDVTRTPGGSSSGSAAAVAAGMVPVAIGTQTKGSIIRPASFCGTYAIKPSHGLVSRHGVLRLSRTLDHVGVFARSIDDIAFVLSAIAGYDPADPDTKPVATADFPAVAAQDWPLTPRIAFIRTPMWERADAATRASFEAIAEHLGDACVPVDLPERFAGAWQGLDTIMATDMADNLAAVLKRGGEAISPTLRQLTDHGRTVSAIDYLSALHLRDAFRAGLAEMFEDCNAILTPATIGVAPTPETTGDPVFCVPWSLAGLPAMSLPLLTGEGGLPVGVQLVGPYGDDARLMRTANWLIDRLSA